MITQNSAVSLLNMAYDSKPTAAESVKARNNDSSSRNQFTQIMNMLKSPNNIRDFYLSDMKNFGRAINDQPRKRFETSQLDAAQKGYFSRAEEGMRSPDRGENIAVRDAKDEVKVSSHDTKSSEVMSGSETKRNKDVRAEENIEEIAAVLGLNSTELKMILNAAGINASDLSDNANVSLISEKLATFLGLDEQMKHELHQIISAITEQSTGIGGFKNILGMSAEDVKKGLNIQGSLKVERITENVTDKLAEVFREKLSEVSLSSEDGQGEVNVGLKEEVVMGKSENALTENVLKRQENDIATNSSENHANGENDMAQEEYAKQYNDAEAENVDTIEMSAFSSSDKEFSPRNVSADNKTDINIQPDTVFFNTDADKVVNETFKPLTENIKLGNEIVRQVVDKANVILDGDKSEMVLSLKPESLGKLSLKVVTENGIVIAKFVAENHQVKQILESNMHLLKENLESQGLNVQGFSVSVRQDSKNEQGYYADNNDGRRNLDVKSQNISVTMANPSEFIQTGDNSSYLNWGSSTINVTA